jgi:hypothetical protein
MVASVDEASIVTRRAAGSMSTIVSRRTRTSGLTKVAYGSRSASSVARQNITSSFE